MLMFALTAVHVQTFARLRQFIPHSRAVKAFKGRFSVPLFFETLPADLPIKPLELLMKY
jgi:hypothetical protein